MTQDELDAGLVNDFADLYDDPLAYVRYAFPWGEGELADYDGPDEWQSGFLKELGQEIRLRNFDGVNAVEPIQFSTASGHGIGKSAMSSFLGCFILDTRPHSKGIWTANSAPQLETKTWAEFSKWRKRSISAHWWKVSTGRGALRCTHIQHPETWRIDAMAWREHQPEAFAGLHNAGSTPWYLFDEASAIPRAIFEVSEGGLTDGEPMRFLFGNPTKNTGFFYDTFHKLRHRFKTRQIDSRNARMTNKATIEGWRKDWGEDSDFFRVRVKGQFPAQAATQFISKGDIEAAQKREVYFNDTDPIIISLDVARYGDDQSVIRVRRGRDARSRKPIKFKKLDTMQLAARTVALYQELLADALIIDAAGVGGPVADRIRQIDPHINLIEFNGGKSVPVADPQYHDWNAYAWGEMRKALRDGLAIDDDPELEEELAARNYSFDGNNAIILEPKEIMKQEIGRSPDNADALAMTYAMPIGPRDPGKTRREFSGISRDINTTVDYDPR
ncbi:terminase [Microvirga mediterraneensis]|uniref:Terminase n=1 Tax=Microvirga mediterraneensis TaxID=2754695 RepID=A0A838BV09_9HYPH|nr:terminase [Microvirga mediterraneensis]MBA1159377.1 terminase [Microvirga mediterraneensis]